MGEGKEPICAIVGADPAANTVRLMPDKAVESFDPNTYQDAIKHQH